MSQPFDFDAALKALQSGQNLTGKDVILTLLIKQLTEAALAAELDSHLVLEIGVNRRNGTTKKASRPQPVSLSLRRPEIATALSSRQTRLSDEIEQKIICLFALISAVTDKVIPELRQWQQRVLEPVYPFVWLDAIHYNSVTQNSEHSPGRRTECTNCCHGTSQS